MNSHVGCKCSSCGKENFRGKRYKCLRCNKVDLCESCQYQGVAFGDHEPNHAVQCILTDADFELYYGGQDLPQPFMPQSLTCSICGQVGFTLPFLRDHVSSMHPADESNVLCPICCSGPANTNPDLRTTTGFLRHLILAHLSGLTNNPHDMVNEVIPVAVAAVRPIPAPRPIPIPRPIPAPRPPAPEFRNYSNRGLTGFGFASRIASRLTVNDANFRGISIPPPSSSSLNFGAGIANIGRGFGEPLGFGPRTLPIYDSRDSFRTFSAPVFGGLANSYPLRGRRAGAGSSVGVGAGFGAGAGTGTSAGANAAGTNVTLELHNLAMNESVPSGSQTPNNVIGQLGASGFRPHIPIFNGALGFSPMPPVQIPQANQPVDEDSDSDYSIFSFDD